LNRVGAIPYNDADMRAIALLLSIVPGLGHVYLSRYAQGVLFFTLFAAAANGLLIGALWQGEDVARRITEVSAVAAALVFVACFASMAKLTLFTDREALARRRDEALRRGLVHYLRDELVEAERALEEALRYDVDRCDCDVLFHLGVVANRLGNARRARRMFKRCLAADACAKWRYEVAQELARMSPAAPPPPREARPEPAPALELRP
jgi:tetratricopeptide (TPR) repeat protein